jgi:ubiquinone/menaquinone biosynthesis C-methylase UbiE
MGQERKKQIFEETMDKPKSGLDFKLMALTYKIRDFFFPRKDILKGAGIKPGFRVLDYGCGPGSYLLPLARLVNTSGEIYALDIHPLAVKRIQRLVLKKNLTNVKTIKSDCSTGLPDGSMDVVLLYDTYHDLKDGEAVLKELHRILKPNGLLSFSDHHLKEQNILERVTSGNLFALLRKGKKTYSFIKSG